MCGFCIEEISFTFYKNYSRPGAMEARWPPHGILLSEFCSLFDSVLPVLEEVDLHFFEKPAVALSICCGALKVLFASGFDSESYQSLINSNKFSAAVAAHCAELNIEAHGLHPTHSALHDKRAYCDADYLPKFFSKLPENWEMVFLNSYIKEFIRGDRLASNDLSTLMSISGIVNPLESVSTDELKRWHEYSPIYYWLALQRLAKSPSPCWTTINEIAFTDSSLKPYFIGNPLWIQRDAALLVFDHVGIAPFVERLGEYRLEILQFIDLKRSIRPHDKALLHERFLLQVGEGDLLSTSTNFSMRAWFEKTTCS